MLKNGQQIELGIEDFGASGEGIGKYCGFAVFVVGAVPGDRVLTELFEVKKSYALGKIIKILEQSGSRINPSCPSFGACGGCGYLHVNYETELKYKKKSVNDAIKRIGGLDFEVTEIIGMDEPYYYRNKTVYHVSDKNGRIEIGFYGAKSHEIADVDKCVIFCEENAKIIDAFKKYMKENGVRPYNKKTSKGLIESITVRRSFHTGDYLVCVTAHTGKLPNSAGLVYHLTESVPEIKGITLTECGKDGKVHKESRFVWGDTYITDKIGEYRFKISPASFFQVNPKITLPLYEKVSEYAGLTKNDTAIDAYSGIGSISIFLSPEAREVIGIELNPSAVNDAVENAQMNGISNVRFIQGDAGSALNALCNDGIRPSAVILDPPRGGCEKGVIAELDKLSPPKIVYVSCNPATLARDMKSFSALGYKAIKGTCADMFPRCAHVETVVLFSKLQSTESIEVKIDLDEMDLIKSESNL